MNELKKKTKLYAKYIVFIGTFPAIVFLLKDNMIINMYEKNPLTMLGVVTSGIAALITMLIFMVNFNVNDIYLGRSKSKVYLEDRVLIQFFKSRIFKLTFLVFLVVTLKLCGIVFKATYMYRVLSSISFLKGLLDIIERYYKDAGVFCFLILSATILLAILGNIEQLFNTMNFKEEEMIYLKRKIEQSRIEKYRKILFYRKNGEFFFEELTDEYKKIKEEEKEKFLQVVFRTVIQEHSSSYAESFINGININVLNEFLNKKYKWIQENVLIEEFLEKQLIKDVLALSYLDKNKFNNLQVDYIYSINDIGESKYDIRINLINKYIKLEKDGVGGFFRELIRKNKLCEDTKFVKYVFKKGMSSFVKTDNLDNNVMYGFFKDKSYNSEMNRLKNEVIISNLYNQNIAYLEIERYKELLELLAEEYKISWSLYKIFEEKSKWSKDVEFAFEILYKTDLGKVVSCQKNIIETYSQQQEEKQVLDKILSILDKSRLNYRMRDKYEFIFKNSKRNINFEFEEELRDRGIELFKFMLICDWINNGMSYYFGELNYFNEGMDDYALINNLIHKLSLYVDYRIINQNNYIYGMVYKLINQYGELIVKSKCNIYDWRVLVYLEEVIDNILMIYFMDSNIYIGSNLILAYFNVLIDKKKYDKLYSNKEFKKELYRSLSNYMRNSNKTLEEIINLYKQYCSLSELEERILKREIDDILIV